MQWVVQGFMQWVVQGFVIRTYNPDIQSGHTIRISIYGAIHQRLSISRNEWGIESSVFFVIHLSIAKKELSLGGFDPPPPARIRPEMLPYTTTTRLICAPSSFDFSFAHICRKLHCVHLPNISSGCFDQPSFWL